MLDTWIDQILDILSPETKSDQDVALRLRRSLWPPSVHTSAVTNESHVEHLTTTKFGRYDARISVNKRITRADWFQDVRHFEFDLSEEIQLRSFLTTAWRMSLNSFAAISLETWQPFIHKLTRRTSRH